MKFLLNVGAEKAGTTWLYDYFVKHPEFIHYGKELNIIQRDDFVPRFEKNVPGVGDVTQYFDFFNSRQQVTGDFTHYEGSSPNIFNIIKRGLDHEVVPVYIMRDPIRRAWSAWNMFGGGSCDLPPAANFVMQSILSCKYKETIQALDSVFGKTQCLYFFYETFFDQANIDYICDKLNISSVGADFTPFNKGLYNEQPSQQFIRTFGTTAKNVEAVRFIFERFDNVPWQLSDY
jgi:hypothetical protein